MDTECIPNFHSRAVPHVLYLGLRVFDISRPYYSSVASSISRIILSYLSPLAQREARRSFVSTSIVMVVVLLVIGDNNIIKVYNHSYYSNRFNESHDINYLYDSNTYR